MKKVGTDVAVPRREDVVVSELENANSILLKYTIYLEDQDDRNIFLFIKTENSRPDAGSSTFEIKRKTPQV